MNPNAPWRRFFAELKRRRVYRVAVSYAATAFVLVQVADLTFERLTLPPWSVTLVIVLVVAGFPIAVLLAWAFEVTPDGVRRTRPVDVRDGGDVVRGRTVFALALGLVIVAAAGWWFGSGGGGPNPSVTRLAVLPLDNLMQESDQEYFVQGMHDGIISELQEVGVPVIARTSVMRFGDGETSVREIARELDVDAVVEGTVFRAGDSVEINARLVDPATEEYRWRGSFAGSLANVLSLHRRLTRAIALEIRVALSPEDESRLAGAPDVDPEAYDQYLKGVYHAQRFTARDLDTAREYFRAALSADSSFAPAYVGLARVWSFRAQAGFVSARRARREAEPMLERAVQLDSTLAEASMAAAGGTTWMDWDFRRGERIFRRAIRQNPRHPETRVFYGHLLTILGRWEEARVQVEEAIELDPLNPFVKGLYGTHLYLTRRYDEAIEVLEETFRRHPGAGFGRAALSASYEAVGRREAALETLTRILEGRGDAEAVAALERGRREGGYRTALRRAADAMAKKARNEYVTPFRIAELYTRAGDGDEAVAWFRRALEAREQNMPYIGVIPALEGLHDDPGFREIVRSVGVPLLDGEGRVRRPR